ncbi:copper amine oxidase N-terminal domain-containing protein [Paenibacillus agilis]|uniref:Copper amine oxidase N-terminal domain-containing protein n=2 Tax=Paenibacillus agilis TaxID=3020863 RepID=A0A559IL73_9BACL|nr:copper amine oxidase N-terminal domain-containing protein [Paenibacillus agilis]
MRVLLSALMVISSLSLFSTQTQAAPAIKVYIDGEYLSTPQPPIVVNSRTLLPLKSVFEGLNATVHYDAKTRTVTSSKSGTTVVLKLGSKTAKVNGKNVTMDVPAQTIRNRTMVPVRFVSQSFGAHADYEPYSRTVHISTADGSGSNPGTPQNPDNTSFSPVRNVRAEITGKTGDASDITVHFDKSSTEANVKNYRILVVKDGNSSSFNESRAKSASYGNYTEVNTHGINQSVNLPASLRDVDGDAIRSGQSYKVYVLTQGLNQKSGLSYASSTVKIPESATGITVTNVKATDVSDYGDGRDLSVSFSRPYNDDLVSNYRVMVVKTKDAHRFDLNAANAVPSQHYSTVYKNGSTLTEKLNSTAKDTAGDYIRNGESYTVFVLSVSNNSYASPNKLSTGSVVTLESASGLPVITKVEDVSNYGDGRDLEVSFNRADDESNVSQYRVFVVKARNASNFNLAEAGKVSSGRYTEVSKNGYYNYKVNLSSSGRDVDGSYLRNGESYQVFVMAVSWNKDRLSAPSPAMTLSDNNHSNAPTNVTVRDVNDYQDGRDLSVSFNKAWDESIFHHYRIFVVKASQVNNFNLYQANNVNSSNYTYVNKTGSNISQILTSSTRDVDGVPIKSGESYRVFVMAVHSNHQYNVLSPASDAITLSGNSIAQAATNVVVRDISDFNDGRDVQVSFNRVADEKSINHYRVLFVKAHQASNFTLAQANNVSSANQAYVSKTGNHINQAMLPDMKDIDGAPLRSGERYRVYVLSVGLYGNILSLPSGEFTLSGTHNTSAVTNVTAQVVNQQVSNRKIDISYITNGNESNVKEYRILLVRADQAHVMNVSTAMSASESNFTRVAKQGVYVRQQITESAKDMLGNPLVKGVAYRAYVLTVSNHNPYQTSALSNGSAEFTLSDHTVPVVSYIAAYSDGNGYSFKSVFEKPANSSQVAYYAVMVVPTYAAGNFTLEQANQVHSNRYKFSSGSGDNTITWSTNDVDIYGGSIQKGVPYKVFVLSISNGANGTGNALSTGSNEIVL